MKKLIVGLLAAALMAFGLVATTGGTASACAPGYNGPCQPVEKPAIKNKVRKSGGNVKVRANFQPQTGNATVYGAVTLTCTNGKATKTTTRGYAGPANIGLKKLKKRGVWKCTLKLHGANSKNAKVKFNVRVR